MLRKLLDDFFGESSKPAVFSGKDPNLRLFSFFEATFETFERFFLDDCDQNIASK